MTLPLVAAGMLLLASPPGAQAAEPFKMGIVDPQAVLEKSKAGKKALDTLKEYVTARQKLLAADEEELRRTEKTLKEQNGKLSDTEKKEKETQFRTRVQEYQKRAQEYNQELQGKQKELVDDYMKRISSATKTVAEKTGFALVVDKGSEQTVKIVIYHKDTIDITDQVIKEFDRVNSK
jgi:outer membrane protein